MDDDVGSEKYRNCERQYEFFKSFIVFTSYYKSIIHEHLKISWNAQA